MEEKINCDSLAWTVKRCPDCGSTKVEEFSYKEGTIEVRNCKCEACGNSWQERVNSFGC